MCILQESPLYDIKHSAEKPGMDIVQKDRKSFKDNLARVMWVSVCDAPSPLSPSAALFSNELICHCHSGRGYTWNMGEYVEDKAWLLTQQYFKHVPNYIWHYTNILKSTLYSLYLCFCFCFVFNLKLFNFFCMVIFTGRPMDH